MRKVFTLLTFIVFVGASVKAQVASKAQVAKQLITTITGSDRPSDEDLSAMKLSVETYSRNNGVSHVYFQQHIGEIPVYNAIMGVHVTRDNKLLIYNSRFASLKGQDNLVTNPVLTPEQAVQSAITALNLKSTAPLVLKQPGTGPIKYTVFDKGSVACEDIKVQLIYQPTDKQGIRLAWQVEIYTVKQTDYWVVRIDAATGQLLDKNNYVVSCDFGVSGNRTCKHGFTPFKKISETPAVHTPMFMLPTMDKSNNITKKKFTPFFADGSSYSVYPYPVESPNHTVPLPPADGRVTVNEPSTAGSPFGWHDTNGVVGAEFTTTQGNNVHAYTDIDADNLPDAGSSPDGGAGLDFIFPIDLTLAPSTYRPAAVTNLFYWNNFFHDFMYGYGFDEPSGNFQVNNYGNGGTGNDDVRAEAQDGSGTNNANFFTPADGSRPRMQMFIGTNPTPDVDGDLDNLVIVHEYGHGVSNRLTGGPANVSCLGNQEQMGEGWSDWYGLMLTMKPTDVATTQRPVGTYLFGQPTTGPGIRPAPYTTDMLVNPAVYDDIKTLAVPHGVGYVWASMIWDLSWELIAKYGMAAGFNVAMNIVTEGMKLQPCSPGFVDGRDAILAADLSLYSGANRCLIWRVFARRGLGFSANQGLSSSRSDGTQAFDLPPTCFVDAVPTTISVCQPNNAVATINVGDGYSGPVTLSVSGNPAGTSVSFSVNPVTGPSSSTLTIGNTGAAVAGTYPITVSGTDGSLTYSDNFSLSIQSAAPAATTLTAPANGAVNVANPVLTWNALAAAETYEVQVATDAGFVTIVASATGLISPNYTPAGLLNLTTYYWRTRAVNICGIGNYSSVFSFTTANVTCATTPSTNVPVTISSSGTPTITSTLAIPTCGTITGVKVQNLNITHTWVGDLRVTLTSPVGTIITLFDRPGVPASSFGCSGDNLALNFDDAAILTAANFENTCGNLPAISGTFQPISALSGLNGENMSGTWTLTVQDFASGDGGTLDSWGLEICSTPCPAPPTITTTGTLSPFTSCSGTASAEQTFTVSGADLTANLVVTAPADFEVSTTSGSGFGSSVTLIPSSGTVPTTTIYVRMAATAVGSPSGNIACTSTGATTQNVAVSGVATAQPTPADAGLDKTICANPGSVAMTGNTPSVGTGTWTQVAGPAAGNIVSPNSPTTNITGLTTPGTYTFQWTITNAPCPPSSDEVDVVVNPNPPTPAISGGNVTVCQGTTVTLSAPADPNYTYQWARHLATEPWVNMGTGQTQAVTTSGLYRVTVTNQFGCSTTSTDVYVNVADYVFNGSLGAGDPQQTGRINRFGVVSTCAAPKVCPGIFSAVGARFYDAYTITNIRAVPVCATIGLNSNCGTNIFNVAY
ncbi:MAG: M36 family metallopeptidase, partial [Sphingobacteriales bacterium]|nr:M36 family metallopeptidase [Sphingobacteriales bacterium]